MADDPSDNRLDSWKEIAAYLGRGRTTVQRWEEEENLPVHRLPHAKRGSVYALKSELDTWRQTRTRMGIPTGGDPAAGDVTAPSIDGGPGSHGPRRRRVAASLAIAALCGFTVAGVGVAWLLGRARTDSESAGAARIPAPRTLAGESTSETHPSLSPDGSQVVFSWDASGVSRLFVRPVVGGPPSLLATNSADEATHPAWSPRGDLIAFLSRESENSRGLHVVAASGGTSRRLTAIAGIGVCWTPDGSAIGFADRNSSSEPFSIYRLDLQTAQRQRLTMAPLGTFGDTYCSFSSDNRRLAVGRYHNRSQSDVYVTDIPERGPGAARRVTTDFAGIRGLSWAPDNETIVFGSHVGLWKALASASPRQSPTLIAGAGTSLVNPAFSQLRSGGSARLTYAHDIRDVNLWALNTGEARTAPQEIAASSGWEDHPAYSLDGERLAFSSNRTGFTELWTARADGSEPKQLTFHRGPLVITPRWSPDGESIAFSSQIAGNRDIYVVRADGSESRRVTSEPTQEENPSWSRDGRWIYFKSDRSGIGQIWKVPADGADAVLVTRGEASQGFESSDGKLLYFVRGPHTPGLWSVSVTGGPETFVLADVRDGLWDLADRGCVFMLLPPALSPRGTAIRLFDLTTRAVTTLADLSPFPTLTGGFAVARDGRSVIWAQLDVSQSDVMLIDPWPR